MAAGIGAGVLRARCRRAIASERGAMSRHVHRPFSFLTQVAIAAALYYVWRRDRSLVALNLVAWGAILTDTALHYLLR